MRSVEIVAIGKLRDRRLAELCQDYYQRCQKLIAVREREVKDLDAFNKVFGGGRFVVLLDERGTQCSSRGFAQKLSQWALAGDRTVVFGIGGADGFSDAQRENAQFLLSLGKMTHAHRLVRVIFAEQLYRAVSILEGGPYHREG